MSPIKAIIFDKDGTLHDTEKVYMQAWKAAAEEFGGIPDIEDTVRDCTGTSIPFIAEYWAKKYPHIPFEDYLPAVSITISVFWRRGSPSRRGLTSCSPTSRHTATRWAWLPPPPGTPSWITSPARI